jgi:hypothetical protein
MAGIYFGCGSTFTWNGVHIADLLTFEWSGGKGEAVEVTNRASKVVGTGAQSRVIRQYDVVSIEPLRVVLTFYGPPPVPGALHLAAGATGLLTAIVPPSTTLTWTATLDDWYWGVDGVDAPQRGSMTFTLSEY